ncbi:hypothetical protein UFOVP635_26 [uncultured Caudovirales phage]|uniref:Uncharacterized protein n=1 Tax=uncultured Caudovirales phage TaxID=2100421 RepID=A0A6J5NE29_9CAUD|nr:hypothetical protein UFOVP635_26 [uncultured Caudovirales phage]
MKLSQLAAKPQLITIVIDDEDTVKELGESLEFQTWDRQPLDVFMKLASANQQDMASMVGIVRTLILDEEGKEVIKDDLTLPSNILIKCIAKVVEKLGK